MGKLKELAIWLEENKLSDEAAEVVSLSKLAGKPITYKVKGGDTLGGIAIKFDTSVSKIQKENNLPNDKIRAGQSLTITTEMHPADETDVVAMTLLGEGGTSSGGDLTMREIMSILLNRADATGRSLREIVLEPLQFSFWNKRDPDDTYHNSIAYGKNSKGWERAYEIAKNKEYVDGIGCSTHYWAPGIMSTPSWAKGDKFEVVYRGKHHIYGIMKDGTAYARYAEDCGL